MKVRARRGRTRPETARGILKPSDLLAILARRTSELFTDIAELNGRLERLEAALREVREECAKLVERKRRRTRAHRRSSKKAPGTKAPHFLLAA
ncbi:MAG TPA: hypothetical protein VGW35_21110 [Methylomirabilota bacterium]|jgi:hypothetical protein|nr:hypothetical protein [Methylomirabilota bacterium]